MTKYLTVGKVVINLAEISDATVTGSSAHLTMRNKSIHTLNLTESVSALEFAEVLLLAEREGNGITDWDTAIVEIKKRLSAEKEKGITKSVFFGTAEKGK